MTKLFLQRCFLIFFVLLSFNVFADSPLTSILFWDISESSLVQKTGRLQGKKKLNNVRFKFLTDPNTTIFDKIALVNAMGWDSNSKFKNSEIFLKKLKKEYLKSIKKDRKQLLKASPFRWNKLEFDEKYIIYLYLLAMDNYWDVSHVHVALDSLKEVEYLLPSNEEYDAEGEFIGVNNNNNIDSKEVFDFIEMLVSSQYLLLIKGIDCEVWEEFNKIRGRDNYSCISNLSIRKALLKSYDYLKLYSDTCESVWYDINTTYCFRNVIHAAQNQQVKILHYPLFIYGEVTIYNQNNNKVFKFIIDGEDYVGLDISDYPLGSYRIQMINTETEPKTLYNLDLIIY
jgi:hypothetical protein